MTKFNSAAILAGGKSSRMGFDKQLLNVSEKRLHQIIIPLLKKKFNEIIVVTNSPQLYCADDVICTTDIYKNLGPLAGIHAALKRCSSEYLYVIACDMPCINYDYIDYMKSQITIHSPGACVTAKKDWIEPFNAFYSDKFLKIMEEDLSDDKASIYHYLKKINTLIIDEKTALKYSPDWSMFLNMNTKQDYYNYLSSKQSKGKCFFKQNNR